jgi:hypothetical protein
MPSEYKEGFSALKKSVSYGTIVDTDLRSAAANTILNYYRENGASNQTEDDLVYAAGLYKENLKRAPNDAYYNYKTAEILDYAFTVRLNEDLLPEFKQYIDRAIE